MQIAFGDLADRLSIIVRKRRIQAGSVAEEEFNDTLDAVLEVFNSLSVENQKSFFKNLCQLSDFNNAIWHLEFEIRTAKETELDLTIVGRRALDIRDLNRQRVAVRSKMNDYSKTGYRIVNV